MQRQRDKKILTKTLLGSSSFTHIIPITVTYHESSLAGTDPPSTSYRQLAGRSKYLPESFEP